jgi:hypothetical protein
MKMNCPYTDKELQEMEGVIKPIGDACLECTKICEHNIDGDEE